MTVEGYAAVAERSAEVANVLRDMGSLVGEPSSGPVQLHTNHALEVGLGLNDLAASLNSRALDTERGLFNVLVIGEFKQGKSTLLNSMLGDSVLPAKAAPATAIITLLVHGNGDQVAVFEENREEPRLLSLADFKREFELTLEDQETLANKKVLDRFQHVKYAQIESAHALVANGVRLVDSPGLGEAVSRTRVATSFLQEAHAVIFVLSAIQLLSAEERKFIEGPLKNVTHKHNVFFVVNRVNQVESEADRVELKRYLRRFLEPQFREASGQVDEDLYRRRVFFVNAYAAQRARMAQPVDSAALALSGLPEAERALEEFLTSADRVEAELGVPLLVARDAGEVALREIAQRRTTLDAPLEKLEERRIAAERDLRDLKTEQERVEQTVNRFREVIKGQIYSNLLGYVEEMKQTWPQDAGLAPSEGIPPLVDLEGISLADILASVTPLGARAQEKIKGIVAAQIEGYIQKKLDQWGEQLPVLIQPTVEEMLDVVGDQITTFYLELERIKAVFARSEDDPADLTGVYDKAERGKVARAAQTMLSVAMLDVSNAAGSLMGRGDWTSWLGRVVTQVIIAGLLATFLSGGLFLIVFIVLEALFVQHHANQFRERMLESIGEKLHERLRHTILEKRDDIGQAVDAPFVQVARELTRKLTARVDETRKQQEAILAQKREATFSADTEKARIDAIEAQLIELRRSSSATHTRDDEAGLPHASLVAG